MNWDLEYLIQPVGFVISELTKPSLKSEKGGIRQTEEDSKHTTSESSIKNLVSKIVIRSDLRGALEGLEGFSHALILYWPHLAGDGSRSTVQVHPMGDRAVEKVGVFASCSPARPNPILATAVEVVEVTDLELTVKGLEAVNGSPVVDIKPYNRHYLVAKDLKMAKWMADIEDRIKSE